MKAPSPVASIEISSRIKTDVVINKTSDDDHRTEEHIYFTPEVFQRPKERMWRGGQRRRRVEGKAS
jgi:hypothetical protein